MENKNKILLAIGAIAAAYFGKKHLDKRSGSGAIWSLGGEKKMSQQAAFAAWGQRQAGLAPWEVEADKTLGLNGFMAKYATDGYDDVRWGPTSENQAIWQEWVKDNKDDYVYIERMMSSRPAARFSGKSTSSASALKGKGKFKDGIDVASTVGRFDGSGGYSSSLSGEGTLKHSPMSPAGRYRRGRRNANPFSPFGMPDIDKFK